MVEKDRRQIDAGPDGERPDRRVEYFKRLALQDPLTGLLNRRGFDAELRRLWGLERAFPMGLLIIDVDHFKSINDSYGHLVGDQVLKESAQLVQASVRESDVVCRYYGGDEMVVILPRSRPAETRRIAEGMVARFRTEVICRGTIDLRSTISVGACQIATGSDPTADRFLIRADRALYRAKQTGRNRVCYADELPEAGEPEAGAEVPVAPAGMADPLRVVLVVDDDQTLCSLFRRVLIRDKFSVLTAGTGAEARQILERERGMVDVALVDLRLAGENGLEVLQDLRAIDDSVIGVVLTGQATVEDTVESLRQGVYDFVQKPIDLAQLTAVLERAIKYRRLVLENRRYQTHLESMVREKSAELSRALEQASDTYQFMLEALADTLDVRERKTGEHSRRVARLSLVLAREMGATPEEVQTIETGALLHDIGKIGVPDSILLKTGPLTAEERKAMDRHPHIGYNIIKAGPGLEEVSEIVLAHQERYDGSGYPRGLKGEDICLGARIFAVADTYDAIRSDRPYSKSRGASEALAEIVRHKGTLFDPAVVEALLRCQREIEELGGWPAT